MTEDRIEREVVIDAPVERVWALITQAEHLGTWFGDAGAEIDLREGGELELRWEEHGTSRGRIERVDEPTAFSFRWAPFKDPGGVEPADGNSTLVEFTLVRRGRRDAPARRRERIHRASTPRRNSSGRTTRATRRAGRSSSASSPSTRPG